MKISEIVKTAREIARNQPAPIWFVPDKDYVEGLGVGDLTLDTFGRLSEVTAITHRTQTEVSYYTSYGCNGATVFGKLTVDRLTRTNPLRLIYNPIELDQIENQLLEALKLNCTIK